MSLDEPLWRAALALTRRTPAEIVFDVGAHTGAMTSLFLEELAEAEVFAFEPDPQIHASLAERFADEPRAHPVGVALGEREGVTAFHRGAATFTSSRFPRNASGRRYFRSDYVMVESTEVRLDTLDAFCAREGVPRIDLLKLDTQGGERDILLGARDLLRDGRVAVIVTEFFVAPHYEGAPLFDEIWSLLRRDGYELFDMFCGPRGLNGQLRYGDAIFVSPEYRRQWLDSAPPEA